MTHVVIAGSLKQQLAARLIGEARPLADALLEQLALRSSSLLDEAEALDQEDASETEPRAAFIDRIADEHGVCVGDAIDQVVAAEALFCQHLLAYLAATGPNRVLNSLFRNMVHRLATAAAQEVATQLK